MLAWNNALLKPDTGVVVTPDPDRLFAPLSSVGSGDPWVNSAPNGTPSGSRLTSSGQSSFTGYGAGGVGQGMDRRSFLSGGIAGTYVPGRTFGAAFSVIIDWNPGAVGEVNTWIYDTREGFAGAAAKGLIIRHNNAAGFTRAELAVSVDGTLTWSYHTLTDTATAYRWALIRNGTSLRTLLISTANRAVIASSDDQTLTTAAAMGAMGTDFRYGPSAAAAAPANHRFYQSAVWDTDALTDQQVLDLAWNDS